MSKKRRKSKRNNPRRAWKAQTKALRPLGKKSSSYTNAKSRNNNRIHRNAKAGILGHPYWSRPGLGDAVIAWVDYKIETTLGIYTEQKYHFHLNRETTRRINVGKKHLTNIEVKKIADSICGYSPGDEMFPDHLTREQALDHIEICEMIREYWESAVYNYLEAEDRYLIIKNYNTTHDYAARSVVKDIAKPNPKFWNCGEHYGALDGKKGELIHNWLSLCGKSKTAVRGYDCYYCQKLNILMTTNKTDRYLFYKRERDNAVKSFQITRLLQSRLTTEEIAALLGPEFNGEEHWISILRIVQDSVARQTNEKEGSLSCTFPEQSRQNKIAKEAFWKKRLMRFGSDMGDNTLNEKLLMKYADLYEKLAEVLDDQDLTITPAPECACKECTGFDFVTSWRKL